MKSTPIRAKNAAAEEKKAAARERVRKHRAALRARGLRPIQLWVPDTRDPGFQSKYAKQLEIIARRTHILEDSGLLPITEEDVPGWV